MRLYSVTEVAYLLDISQSSVRIYAEQVATPILDKGIYKYRLNKNQVYYVAKKTMREDAFFSRFGEIDEEQPKDEGEEAHPLVTDKRLLKTSFFPDVEPSIFADVANI